MIVFRDLSFSYAAPSWALHNLNLTIPLGCIFALLGPNGAGKTTLLRLLTGRLPLQQGALEIPPALQASTGSLDPRKYGMLIENPGIYARLTIAEYLRFFGGFYQVSDLETRMADLCNSLEIADLNQKLSQLSLGTRQKLQLVRTLLHEPQLVLLDEPTSNLDPTARAQIWQLLTQWNQQKGTTIVVCSHLLSEMQEHCTHLGIIQAGQIQSSGTLASVLASASGPSQVRIHLAPANVAVDQFVLFEEIATLYPHLQNVQFSERVLSYTTAAPQVDNVGVCSYLQLRQQAFWQVEVRTPSLTDIYHQQVSKHVAHI